MFGLRTFLLKELMENLAGTGIWFDQSFVDRDMRRNPVPVFVSYTAVNGSVMFGMLIYLQQTGEVNGFKMCYSRENVCSKGNKCSSKA